MTTAEKSRRKTTRGARVRAAVDQGLDALRFRVDTFPSLDYQPLPWVGRPFAARSSGCESRWAAIDEVLREVGPQTALDIGANVGWFTFQLANRGIATIAMERVPKFYRALLYATGKRQDNNVALLTAELNAETASTLPRTDAVLFLSVWHHLVRERGLVVATRVLEDVWAAASVVLFFETGETEMGSTWGLPTMEPSPREWIESFLETTCKSGEVRHLGEHDAFDADGEHCRRNLFGVIRKAGA